MPISSEARFESEVKEDEDDEDEERKEDDVGRPKRRESLNHLMVTGSSPFVTEHKTLNLCPSCRDLGNEKGSISGRIKT
jgi:hypothetical protein